MDTTGIELLGTESAPIILGADDYTPPVLVKATGYGYGFRLNQVGWVAGDDVQEALDSRLLIPVVDGDNGADALLEPGAQRFAETVPELGIQPRHGTDADTAALTADATHDPAGARDPQNDNPADHAARDPEATYDLDATNPRPPRSTRSRARG